MTLQWWEMMTAATPSAKGNSRFGCRSLRYPTHKIIRKPSCKYLQLNVNPVYRRWSWFWQSNIVYVSKLLITLNASELRSVVTTKVLLLVHEG